jgi:hypothetical protein
MANKLHPENTVYEREIMLVSSRHGNTIKRPQGQESSGEEYTVGVASGQ